MLIYNANMRDQVPNYSPRWLSWFFQRLNGLPVPFWAISVLIVIGLAAARHWIAWQNGWLPQGQINSFLVANPMFSLGTMIAWQYMDHRAGLALRKFFTGSRKQRKEIDRITNEFLSLPAIPASGLFILGGIIGYGGFLDAVTVDPQATQVWPLITIVGFGLTLAFSALLTYRILRQIKMMRSLLANTEADIFNPQPVYALSSYGAAIALAILLAYTIPSLPLANFFVTPGAIINLYVIAIMLLVVFFIPLSQINTRMRSNKESLLAEIGNDLQQVQVGIHKAVSKKQFAEVDKMRGTLSALREERELIQKMPTWPWQPETLRNLLTPFLIPVIVFLITRYLGAALGLQ